MEKKKYNSKMYNDKFREKHAEKIATKTVCTGCGRTFTYYTKSKHMKTKKHLLANPPTEHMQAIIPKEDETHFWKLHNHFFKPEVVPDIVPVVIETPIIIN
jgi:predicted Fe-S protein YdhL (DUF1289 family)